MDFKTLTPFGRGGLTAEDPFLALRREMDRAFGPGMRDWPLGGTVAATAGFLTPKVNVAETAAGLEVSAELPGIDQKDIDLDLSDGVLTIKAEHRAEAEKTDEKKHYHLVERSVGTFLRRFALPFDVEPAGVEATFENGVLKIAIPRRAKVAPEARKITIRSGPA